jgi:hypothetical protein
MANGKKVNGKNKGNVQERKISNILSKRFETITGLKQAFYRNSDSGSFFGRSNQKRMETHNLEKAVFGDIVSPSNFIYEIECKHYKTPPTLATILNQDYKQWDTWIKQAQQDSANSNREMAVIIKYNNIQELVILEKLPEGMTYLIKYKQFFIITLTSFLELPDSHFFKDLV